MLMPGDTRGAEEGDEVELTSLRLGKLGRSMLRPYKGCCTTAVQLALTGFGKTKFTLITLATDFASA
jgi:hypothetical protein